MLKLVQKFRHAIRKDGETSRSWDESEGRKPRNSLGEDESSSNDGSAYAQESPRDLTISSNHGIHVVIKPECFFKVGLGNIKCSVYLCPDTKLCPADKGTVVFRTDKLVYEPFCDDFGPMNLLSVTSFIKMLDEKINKSKPSKLIYCADEGVRNFTNAAFLLGAYMILKLDRDPEYVADCFSAFGPSAFEGFRDATFLTPTFRLQLIDCWRGLHRAKSLQWIAMPSGDKAPDAWGQIDMADYQRYDDYLNGDLHVVVPGRFVAFRAPKVMHARNYQDSYADGRFVSRDFAPKHYASIFRRLGVSAVVRLNEASYPRREFTDSGLDHHDLFFEDCTAPPAAIVSRFFEVSDRARGLVAVHCKAGLGRTCTLIALSLIRSHGFSPREAMGWLRIVRPGAVIGEQQEFLCAVGESLRRGSSMATATAAAAAGDVPPPAPAAAPRSEEAPPAVESSGKAIKTPAAASRRRASVDCSANLKVDFRRVCSAVPPGHPPSVEAAEKPGFTPSQSSSTGNLKFELKIESESQRPPAAQSTCRRPPQSTCRRPPAALRGKPAPPPPTLDLDTLQRRPSAAAGGPALQVASASEFKCEPPPSPPAGPLDAGERLGSGAVRKGILKPARPVDAAAAARVALNVR